LEWEYENEKYRVFNYPSIAAGEVATALMNNADGRNVGRPDR